MKTDSDNGQKVKLVGALLSLKFVKYDNTEGGYTAIFCFEKDQKTETIHLPRKFIEHIAEKFSEPNILNAKVKTILK